MCIFSSCFRQPKQITEPIFEKRCKVDPTPFHSNCISPNETVFVLKTPTANGTYEYPANIVCYWNTPALGATQQLYVDTLRMDVEGNPSESCPDKLIIESDNQDYNRVACGTADMPVLFNELIDNKLEPIFLSNAVTQETGVELLMVYLGEDTTSVSYHIEGTYYHSYVKLFLCANRQLKRMLAQLVLILWLLQRLITQSIHPANASQSISVICK